MQRSILKRSILWLIEHHGYVVFKIEDYGQAKAELERLHSKIAACRADLERAGEEIALREAELGRAGEEIALREAELGRAGEWIAAGEAELERMNTELAQLRQAEQDAQATVFEIGRKLAQADREFRLGRDRDARELEKARTETWVIGERLQDLQDQLKRSSSAGH